ncbi:MAG: DUF2842 domain-containing protein [Paracoccaceae bacterium]|jgi:hypothetical protein
MSHRARKRLALLILLVGLPLYVILAVSLVNWLDRSFGRLPIWAEVPLYAILAFAWAFPLKPLFRGIGQAGPDD